MTMIETAIKTSSTTRTFQAASYRQEYERLLARDSQASRQARTLLQGQLRRAAELSSDLPATPEELEQWAQHRCAAVAAQYAEYLQTRQQGGERRYFRNRSHALYFIQHVAPTKVVDGAWLAGIAAHWQDPRFDHLLDTYLEELGDGLPRQNHVLIYRKLLAEHDCDDLRGLSDDLYLQGALQLALGQCSDEFLPEVIGYNLGYEQLPLHLLISTYELRELGIDPQYFRLHVTIDNASTGHAHKAVQALLQLLPLGAEREAFYRRVSLGYRLNDLGKGSTDVIQAFDLEREVIAMLERKCVFGQHMHSDYCRLENRTINQWLAVPGQMGEFLAALQRKGWIKRGEPVEQSRFWQLIDGSEAVMFGVFSGYEKQLLRDWITDTQYAPRTRPHVAAQAPGAAQDEIEDAELLALREQLEPLTPGEQMQALLPWLSARRHWRPAGLFATRRFVELRGQLR
ncbi:iron-containing redox enzyme family protein [Pseudomonas hamedanensis]|uniref:Iron-containing redox enzyme family protein n=1 Tax=Pseudomonas hamedanensis TaxID=2745504 RepID=A0A9E6THB8_9PSED|nr:iron-containing redox enzyme family protein [Pseudomonas hamedanensis]